MGTWTLRVRWDSSQRMQSSAGRILQAAQGAVVYEPWQLEYLIEPYSTYWTSFTIQGVWWNTVHNLHRAPTVE